MNLKNARNIRIGGGSAVQIQMDGVLAWSMPPEGFKLLDYIEMTGTNYINTGFIPNQDTRIICEFMYKGGNGIYGARTSTASNNYALRMISGNWQPGYNAKLATTSIKSDTTQWHIADQNKNMFSLDGEIVMTFDYENFKAPKPIILGGIYANNSVYYGEGRYRRCTIYDNGVLAVNLIPCKAPNGTIGMYDTVSAIFIAYSGTEEPIAGAEI